MEDIFVFKYIPDIIKVLNILQIITLWVLDIQSDQNKINKLTLGVLLDLNKKVP